MSESRIKDIIKQRGSIQAKLINFSNFLNSISNKQPLNELHLTELECRLARLSSLATDFDNVQTDFEALFEGDDEELYVERHFFEDKYYALLAAATTMINATKRAHDEQKAARSDSTSSSNAKSESHDSISLHKFYVPEFDGSYQNWQKFKEKYLYVVHKTDIGNINKFALLRYYLKGDAFLIIQNIDYRAENYETAWNLITDTFENPEFLINKHLNALFSIETAQEQTSHLLRNVVDVTNKHLNELSCLGQPTDHWGTPIIHIMCKKLDSKTFTEWAEHCVSMTTFPTLTQFLNFLTQKADLLDTIQLELQKRKEQNKIYNSNCPICNRKHILFRCPEFRNLDVFSRIEKTIQFNLCYNCLRPGHIKKDCKFSHCKYCDQKHNTLLHTD